MADCSEMLVVGLDCGTSVVKAAAFDPQGNEVAVAQSTLEGLSPQRGWMEYRPEDMWSAAAGALRELVNSEAVSPDAIAAIGPTGAGNGVLLLDEDDSPVRNGIFAVDTRAADMMARDAEEGMPAKTRAINGQTTWTGQTFCLLKWLREHEPESLDRAAKVLVIKDYVKFRLTGQYVGDASEQSKVGLMDISRGECTEELLALYNIEALLDRLPPIRGSTEVIGGLTAEAARETGLKQGTPVVSGLADIDASALGAGVVRAGQMSIVAGTWSINQLFVDEPAIDPRFFGLSFYAVEGVYEHLEASPSSTANLTWFINQACGDLQREAEDKGCSVYDLINELVDSVEPASTEVFFHPYLYGANTKTNARAGFYGLAGWQDRADLLAALYEGVVFSHNHHVEKLRTLEEQVSEIRLSGGAARSEVWSRMFADVIGLPVTVPRAQEVGALGAAMCAAVGADVHPDLLEAADRMVHTAHVHQPDAELHERYAERYECYKRVTELMGPVWDKLSGVFSRPEPGE